MQRVPSFVFILALAAAAWLTPAALAHTGYTTPTSEPASPQRTDTNPSETTITSEPSESEPTGIEHEDIGIVSEEDEEESSQYKETDLEFVTRLFESGGVYIKYDDIEGESTAEADDPDQPLITGQVPNIQVTGVEVRGWDPAKKSELAGIQLSLMNIDTGEELAIVAAQAVNTDTQMEEVTLNFSKIKVNYLFPAKLFGFINIQMRYEVTVELQSGEEISPDNFGRVKVKLPWWHFLSKKLVNVSDLEAALEEELAGAGEDAQLANIDLQNASQRAAYVLQTLSNILKLNHDTAMAIIRKVG